MFKKINKNDIKTVEDLKTFFLKNKNDLKFDFNAYQLGYATARVTWKIHETNTSIEITGIGEKKVNINGTHWYTYKKLYDSLMNGYENCNTIINSLFCLIIKDYEYKKI